MKKLFYVDVTRLISTVQCAVYSVVSYYTLYIGNLKTLLPNRECQEKAHQGWFWVKIKISGSTRRVETEV